MVTSQGVEVQFLPGTTCTVYYGSFSDNKNKLAPLSGWAPVLWFSKVKNKTGSSVFQVLVVKT